MNEQEPQKPNRSKSTPKPPKTTDLMQLYVKRLSYEAIFTSRDLLPFASRSSVDQFTSQSVKNGYLERLTRGVFRKLHPYIDIARPSETEIYLTKRRAFANKLVEKEAPTDFTCKACKHSQKSMNKARILDAKYFGDGHSTSLLFTPSERKAELLAMAPRKLALSDTRLGRALRDLWLLGEALCTADKVQCMLQRFTYRELLSIVRYRKLIPQWLSEMIPLYPTAELVKMLPKPGALS
ncbi:MAG: hypothetical protein LCH63_08620 [Candidatus Melainabacteria bacterium]|nr:hypothetical protein [Candidatus Melainabacteria bacterium]